MSIRKIARRTCLAAAIGALLAVAHGCSCDPNCQAQDRPGLHCQEVTYPNCDGVMTNYTRWTLQ